ncbi:MAG: NAD-dependent epimerase/dehydratase family protein [Candidatus Yanofskybacteria bacterium]|nr:NAD-dependent epimerase/dehydratase family protein [Candidatus Yanofskybacteria bacterium]
MPNRNRNKSKKVLVTGGAGFIGSHIVDRLIELGYSVRVVDDLSTGKLGNINKKAKFTRLHLAANNAPKILSKLLRGVTYVFHLAAIPRMQYSVENPIECHHANVNGLLNLLDACVKNKIKKFIHSSSCSIYGLQEKMPISENALLNLPGTPYALQKLIQEQYVNLYIKLYGLPAVMLRYFNVYGTKRQSESGSYPNVLAAFCQQKRLHGKVFVTGDGTQRRDMVHVFDVAEANLTAMRSSFKNGETFNIGTGTTVSINEAAGFFNCPIEYIPQRPGDAKCYVADINKAKKLLKWKPKISFEKGMAGYLKEPNEA